MTEKNEEDFRNNNICRVCEKEILSHKVRDHCHLTGRYRKPAHSNRNINVTQNLILYLLHFIILVIMIVTCSSRE